MKKIILFFISAFLITTCTFSQSLTLSNPAGAIPDGGIVTVTGDTNVTIETHIYVTNIAAVPVDVKVTQMDISILPGTVHYFCWGSCFNPPLPAVFTSPSAITINSNDTNKIDFTGDYQAKGNIGTTEVKYVFFNANDTTDAVSVNIHFYAGPVGIKKFSPEDIVFSDAFPNPAVSNATIEYELPKDVFSARVIIRDLIGNSVKEIELNDLTGKLVINTSDLNSGIYFYSLLVNDQFFATKKLIIRN